MASMDRKKAVAEILGPVVGAIKGSPKDEGPSIGHTIASEMIDAFHAKDSSALWDSIKAAIEAVGSDSPMESPSSEEE